jgi:sirohydrochlorin ferrochelatase
VLAASGSTDARAHRAVAETASLLASCGGAVEVGHLGGSGRPLAEALEAARRTGRRPVVATFLLAPGFFHDRAHRCGAAVVTAPLLDGGPADPRLVAIVLDRFVEAVVRRQPVPGGAWRTREPAS